MNKESKFICPGRWYTECDLNGVPVKAVYDRSYREVLGYESEQEYADAQKKWSVRIHPDDAQRVEDHFLDVTAKHPEGMDYDIEYRIMTKWGYRWIHDCGHCTRPCGRQRPQPRNSQVPARGAWPFGGRSRGRRHCF